jgi:glutathione S-transferase
VDTPTLAIGNKNYSSWSLRAWLVLRHAVGTAFREELIPLSRPDSREKLLAQSPTARVPVLRHGDVVVWDSLAICEHLAEAYPGARLLPDDPRARACARSVSAEMHAGFAALRAVMPMNVRARLPGCGRTPASLRDIERVCAIWRDCRKRFGEGGPFLFGRFSFADAMYAPVVLRFRTYGVALAEVERAYADAVVALPAVQDWIRAAEAEAWTIDEDDYPAFRA